jgi:hypothetical protein
MRPELVKLRALRVVGVMLVLLFVAGACVALAAEPYSVALHTAGGYAKQNVALCGAQDPSPYAYFHRGTEIQIRGAVQPRPSARAWHVTVRVKRCVGSDFQGVTYLWVPGRSDGSFHVRYLPRSAGVFTFRTYYDSRGQRVKSSKVWVVVR